ncbi:glutamine-hydrolyzing carbamoyl-phosphate synthase small subunit [Ehrlichia ruminantium]|uniref:glutamine-hydrolyzing carbamoyl-phosphate synthase small subunit n=1 Tax=Ehrlichia ruminantium TaxID=779 RepID=UPI00004A0BE7|nr:glutamine-hydrolyzing carbamoyl-phosphate synthase small subunit [Ehrlichia ruminantium]QLK50595.1 glutamine-hydrolyzing carbamoyl-phosphate synthase small subunit [Ehrlichia ruminantium]QLK51520.1 glutamine-hydrolyzing carbamoyl-phosphate synthase small subunit [Ehrlichia ruminantium]QLK53355.1 glutamine-hydrolyzing carbamoyl-phosphate synthase small subunit [Ehrlichia ruminantium]QLK55195.1 glutamine-hydrolyzing carbamoyl-phosphate synthase small subunit [Ehrlichia ruminantium]QLK56112.1 
MSQIKNYLNAILMLSDGKYFLGKSIGNKSNAVGEVCFTTSMTGYQHTITDPSFAGQIITFTFPHIGNIGINKEDFENTQVLAHGIVVKTISEDSHSSSYSNLENWMIENKITGISEIDTRALTRHLRNYGSQNGIIHHFHDMNSLNLKELQNTASQYNYVNHCQSISQAFISDYNQEPKYKTLYNIVVINFGVKSSILNALSNIGCKVHIVPGHEFNLIDKILSFNPDGIVLSNGPGDPSAISEHTIQQIRSIIELKVPTLGICLGHQLIALALGAQVKKMLFGHRGSNHPVYNKMLNNIEITSQNHGFTIDENSLSSNIQITHTSLFDNTIEGIKVENYPIISVQYHPEGSPGPNDTKYILEDFVNLIQEKTV